MKVKVTVPTSIKDIKLSQYQKLLRTTKGIEDADWINKQTVAILCNLSDGMVKNMHKKDYDSILKTLNEVLQQKGTFTPIIEHNGKEYGFIPNLEEITVGEQADIDTMINDFQNMHKVMAVMYRPITAKRKDKYLIEDYKGGETLDLDMDVVNGATGFFLSLLNDLLTCTQNFIVREVTQPQTSELLEKNGVGIKTFLSSLEATSSNLKEYLNLNYMRL